MEFITEGNIIYSVRYVGSNRIQEFYGYVVPPDPIPDPPDKLAMMQSQIDQLIVTVGDLALGGL